MTKESKRNLSPKESERKAQFDVVCKTMEKEGYTKTDLTVGIIQANIFAIILMMPFARIVIFLYRMKNPSGDFYFGAGFIWLFALFLFLIVVHEGIHGLTWSMFAKKHFHSIEFGVIWQALTPYCTCSEPLSKWQYIIGAAMPTLILGFALSAAAVCFGNPELTALSVMMIFSGGGDGLIILKLLLHRTKGKTVVYYDHPYECGVVAFER